MIYRIAVEDIEPNHWLAWLLDLPGCFSSAQSEAEAIEQVPAAITAHYRWLAHHDPALPVVTGPVEVRIEETFYAFPSPQTPDYLVNAFFADDRRPLTYWDVSVGLRLLEWAQLELQQLLASPTSEPPATEAVADILSHIAGAENWYFSRLNLALRRSQLPVSPFDRLAAVRSNSRSQLVRLIGDEQIISHHDEHWSARKILRRTLWHEQDHLHQFRQLIGQK